jgi:NAD(P)-dependent dehydrogenase (short-subunit alcohol dehydrogenase family)
MKKQHWGRIIHVSSIAGAGTGGPPGGSAYAASKHALRGMIAVGAVELGEFGITGW